MAPGIAASTAVLCVCLCAALSAPLAAQSTRQPQPTTQPQPANTTPGEPVASLTLPKDYIIGVEDLLSVVFWRDKELSAEVVVRPDGKISLPMLNDVPAAGMTPEQLATAVQKAAMKFVRDPGATKKGDVVIVRNENGQEHRYKFNYNDVVRGRKVEQNIRLLPGDTILIR
jgi:polysaccharide export outer membrane protein